MWDAINWADWSIVYPVEYLTDGRDWSTVLDHEVPGVYRIVALAADWPETALAPINRVCGSDVLGTLYIGQGWIHRRLYLHVTKLRASNPARLPGWSPALLARFPNRRLAVCWKEEPTIEAARSHEVQLLHAYWTRFGDLPPVNRNSSKPAPDVKPSGI